jgi:OOP family OmpA-OmpF porin
MPRGMKVAQSSVVRRGGCRDISNEDLKEMSNQRFFQIASLGLAAAFAFPVAAQQTTSSAAQYRMPYEREFWGYAGINVGRSDYDRCVSGFSCNDTDAGLKIYAGGKIRNAIGLEVSYVDLGKADIGGGQTEGRGLNVSALFGVPIGEAADIHAKVGATYGWTEVSATAPGLATGKERGWEPSVGIGATIGLVRNWQLRLDWDRFRMEFPGGRKDNVDMLSAGVQYRF